VGFVGSWIFLPSEFADMNRVREIAEAGNAARAAHEPLTRKFYFGAPKRGVAVQKRSTIGASCFR
jgi:hypothetical protein